MRYIYIPIGQAQNFPLFYKMLYNVAKIDGMTPNI
jgi:hypothetical protein